MNRKRIAGAAVATLVGLGMLGAVAPASAALGDVDNITITGAKVVGRTFIAYKLADYEQVWLPNKDEGKLARVNLVTDTDIVAALKTWLITTSNEPKYDGSIDPLTWIAENWTSDGSDAWNEITSTAPNVRALATWLAGQDFKNLTAVSMPATRTTTAELDVTEGLWLVIDTTGDSATTSQSLPIILGTKFMDGTTAVASGRLATGVTQPLATIAVKGDLVEIDKDIVGAGEDSGFASECIVGGGKEPDATVCGDALTGKEDEDSATASTGDTVTFRIRTNVPLYPDTFLSPTFEIHDTWSTGLLIPATTTIQVEADGTPLTDFNVVWNDGTGDGVDNPQSFIIKLTNPKDVAGKVLEVTYSAKVINAPTGSATHTHDTNTASVTFTNEWAVDDNGVPTTSGGQTDETAKDEVDVYTYPLQIVKGDLNAPSTYLAATFTMFAADGQTEVGRVTTTTDGTPAYVTALDGQAKGFKGNAWYMLKETTVPNGYTDLNKDVAQFWVYIAADHDEMGSALVGDGDTSPKWYFTSAVATGDAFTTLLSGGKSTINSAYVLPTVSTGDSDIDMDVKVLNARSASDMPSTGGQILLWVGIAGALGLGAVTFAAIGVKKSRKTARAA